MKDNKVLVRNEATTDDSYGYYFDKRPMKELLQHGIINIDKPKGPTSHQVSSYVQNILNIKKSGHSGTLDPGVTGCLPVALEKATRILQFLPSEKVYITLMHIHDNVPEEKLLSVLEEFRGKINQLPPKKSAVKRQWRIRQIYDLDILEIKGKDILFRVKCQAGTYIRKLCHDIGESLGCGAHMAELRRSISGQFHEDSLVTLQDLTDYFHYYNTENNEEALRKYIIPYEQALGHMKKIWIFDTTVNSLCNGADLAAVGVSKVSDDIKKDDTVAVLTLKGELVCCGTADMTSEEIVSAKKGIATRTYKVFMDPGIYPNYKDILAKEAAENISQESDEEEQKEE